MRNRKYSVPKNYESRQAVLVSYEERETGIEMCFEGVSPHDLKELGALMKCEDWCTGTVLVKPGCIYVFEPDWFLIEYVPRCDLLSSMFEQIGYTLSISSKTFIP